MLLLPGETGRFFPPVSSAPLFFFAPIFRSPVRSFHPPPLLHPRMAQAASSALFLCLFSLLSHPTRFLLSFDLFLPPVPVSSIYPFFPHPCDFFPLATLRRRASASFCYRDALSAIGPTTYADVRNREREREAEKEKGMVAAAPGCELKCIFFFPLLYLPFELLVVGWITNPGIVEHVFPFFSLLFVFFSFNSSSFSHPFRLDVRVGSVRRSQPRTRFRPDENYRVEFFEGPVSCPRRTALEGG